MAQSVLTSMGTPALDTKLSAARTRLIIDRPFLGALVLRLPLTPARPGWCKTTATDARKLYYNPIYIEALTLEQTQFMLAHEALHCALSHFARRGHRDKRRWDLACDLAVNPLLVHEGLVPPPGVWMDARFDGMTAEEIYPYMDADCDEPTDQHLYDASDNIQPQHGRDGQGPSDDRPEAPDPGAGSGQRQGEMDRTLAGGASPPPPLSEQEKESLSIQWQQRLAGAAQQAMQAGKLGGALARMVDFLLQPRLPWRALLAHYMTRTARDDYSYQRPSARRGDPAIYPSLRSHETRLVVALDTSGSVSDQELREFVAEIDAIKSQLRARIVLLACDAGLAADGPWTFEPWEPFVLPRRFAGGGGTDFTPVFAWLDRQDILPDLLLYFTDAEGVFPAMEPRVPVVWLVKGKAPVPWGQRVQLN